MRVITRLMTLVVAFAAVLANDAFNDNIINHHGGKIHFTPVGKTVSVLAHGHLITTLNLTKIETTIRHGIVNVYQFFTNTTVSDPDVLPDLTNMNSKFNETFDHYSAMILDVHFAGCIKNLDNSYKQVQKLIAIFEGDDDDTKQRTRRELAKRAAPLAVIAAGINGLASIAGIGLGISNSNQIREINSRVDMVQKKQDLMMAVLSDTKSQLDQLAEEVTKHLNKLFSDIDISQKAIYSAHAVSAAASAVETYTEIITSALAGRWDIRLTDAVEHGKMLEDLREQAESKDMITTITDTRDLINVDTSYIAMSRGVIRIMGHVPMTKAKFQLDVYEYSMVPHMVGNQLIRFKTNARYLAISSSPSIYFTAITDAEFSQCRIIKDSYFCKRDRLLIDRNSNNLRGDDRCLLALFKERMDVAMNVCPVEVVAHTGGVAKFDSQNYIFYSSEKHKAFMTCANGTTTSLDTSYITEVTIPSGCTVETDTAIAFGLSTFTLDDEKLKATTVDSIPGLEDLTVTQVRDMMSHNSAPVNLVVNRTDAQQALIEKSKQTLVGNIVTEVAEKVVLILVVIVAVIFGAKYLIQKYFLKNKESDNDCNNPTCKDAINTLAEQMIKMKNNQDLLKNELVKVQRQERQRERGDPGFQTAELYPIIPPKYPGVV